MENKDLTELEKVEQEIADNGIELIHYPFKSKRLKGVYITNKENKYIALSKKVETESEKVCILTEELAHHEVSSGNISDDKKAELSARFRGYNKLVGLKGLVSAYENNCSSLYEIAEHLNITNEYLSEVLSAYETRYGISKKYKEYLIVFKPYFEIRKIA